jgi:hypothetical protein
VVRFMLEISAREGDKHLCAKALREFPRILPARNASQRKSSLQKASRWFKMGLDDLKAHGKGTVSSQRRHGRARLEKKVGTAGRGRKTATWVSALYVDAKTNFVAFVTQV